MPDVPFQIFCSFAPEDADLCRQLHDHLRPLERQGRLHVWHSRLITAGTDWSKTIEEQLASASIILLLISPAFFASDYCYGIEMQQAMQRHEAGDARVIPVLIRPVNWQEAPFSRLSVLPMGKEPVTLWSDRDAAFAEIVAGIYRVVEELVPSSTNTFLAGGSVVWTVPFQRHPFFTGQYEQAELLCRRSLSIYEQHLGPDHPDTANSLNDLAILYRQQDQYEQAELLFLRALAVREHTLGPTHPDLGETLHEFAILRQAQSNDYEARSLYERALATRTETLGVAHPNTTATRERLIALLYSMGRMEEAVALEEKQDQCR